MHDPEPVLADETPPRMDPAGSGARPEIDSELHAVAHHVHEEFDAQLDPGAVDEALKQVTARFEGAPVRVFVPLLVRRYAREELQTRLRKIE